MVKNKKAEQLGMNPSTASGRLVKDLLFDSISEKNFCYHCGKAMTRENFTIEHKIPWLDSEDPVGLFFDLNNIAFSHHSCNVAAARVAKRPIIHGKVSGWKRGCRCTMCLSAKAVEKRKYYHNKKSMVQVA